jgi:hypothetical protein
LDLDDLDLTQDDLEDWYEDPEQFIPDDEGVSIEDLECL